MGVPARKVSAVSGFGTQAVQLLAVHFPVTGSMLVTLGNV